MGVSSRIAASARALDMSEKQLVDDLSRRGHIR
jgi:hypothetical protein